MAAIDSVAALVPRPELDGQMGDSDLGLQARLMSRALRKLAGAISRSRTTLIFTDQLRDKIGVMFGNPETTTGGRALKFHASMRLDIRRIDSIKARFRRRRQSGQGQSRQEQGCATLSRGRVRHPVGR